MNLRIMHRPVEARFGEPCRVSDAHRRQIRRGHSPIHLRRALRRHTRPVPAPRDARNSRIPRTGRRRHLADQRPAALPLRRLWRIWAIAMATATMRIPVSMISREHDLMAGATTTTTSATSARDSAGGFCGRAVRGATPRGEDRKLNCVPIARALRAANFLLLVQDNFLEMRLAILANVFVNWHVKPRSDRFHTFYRR
jgi:hypothetical protein